MNVRLPFSPVRTIGIATRGVRGVVPGFGTYESTLERDLMEILRFDRSVEEFVPQPLKIEFQGASGQRLSYTPDGLIFFKATEGPAQIPVLYEVKFRADFRKEWRQLIPKFRAAKNYCMKMNWRFEVFTEREIRTPYLGNARFLTGYLEQSPSPEKASLILQTLSDLDEADPDLLLCALCRDPMNRARMIPFLWNLIATGQIGCDLQLPLNMRSRIWAIKD